ncbi:MAG TPA: Vms1/Ankzf1 family peptidyl-tRNA hydrolase [Amnibacterium sp.]|nr:Vms1/Ankzf1 family peptidyl-tRNA hydrolase [Amnibacterium sp.]
MTAGLRARLTEAVRRQGRWTTVYLDLSNDRENPEGLQESRRRSIRDRLRELGASEAAVTNVDDRLTVPTGLPAPFRRYLLVRDDEVQVDEAIPGTPAGAEVVSVGPAPLIAPLIRSGVEDFSYLVVQVSRDGGDIAVHRTGAFFPELSSTMQGRTDTLHKVKGGGWAHLNQQEHVEEIWKQTQMELSAEVDRLVLEHRPRLVVVAGDIKARRLLLDALADRSRGIAVELPKDTRSGGADPSALVEFTERQIQALLERDQHDVLDLLHTRLGQEQRSAASAGVRSVVEALRQAQADTLLLDIDALADRELLALDDQPWVAAEEGDVAGAGVVAAVPAAEALIRSALLTDATVLLARSADLAGEPAAALLRWPADVPAHA